MRLRSQPQAPEPPPPAMSVDWMIALATSVVLAAVWIAGWFAEGSMPLLLALSLGVLLAGVIGVAVHHGLSRRPEFARKAPPADAPDSVPALFSEAVHGKRWSLDVFRSIDARRFAAVCETWFSWAGFDTRLESHRTDDGVDIWLHAPKVPGPVAIVRCRHGHDRPIDVRDLQEFVQLMAPFRAVHGTYTTTSTYTAEALEFARAHGIDAVDGRGLLRRIQTRTRQRQQALLAIACAG